MFRRQRVKKMEKDISHSRRLLGTESGLQKSLLSINSGSERSFEKGKKEENVAGKTGWHPSKSDLSGLGHIFPRGPCHGLFLRYLPILPGSEMLRQDEKKES